MTWTYTITLATNLNRVRFLIGDTDTTDQQLADEEINWVITQAANVYLAASKCCEALAVKYARQADTEVGDLSVKKSQRRIAYLELAKSLKSQGAIAASVFAASLSIADKQSYEADTDIPAPKFFINMQDNPGQEAEQPATSEKTL